MEELKINIMLVIVVIAIVCKMVDGYKKGMVKEVISMISMVVLCVVAALIAYGVNSYHDGKVFNVAIAVILLVLLATAHHLLGLALFPAKLAAKLPVIHLADKLLGIVFGAAEIILILWTLYAFTMMMDMGAIGQMLLSYTEDSAVLTWLYQYNYLAHGIQHLLSEFDFVSLNELLQKFL